MLKIMEFCAQNNEPAFNYNKAVEECVEFMEVLVKSQTKSKERQPPKEEMIKEFGDVQYRGMIALMTKFPEMTKKQLKKEINAHVKMKLKQLEEWQAENNKFKGGL